MTLFELQKQLAMKNSDLRPTWLKIASIKPKILKPDITQSEKITVEKTTVEKTTEKPFDVVAWYRGMHKEVGYEEYGYYEYDADY